MERESFVMYRSFVDAIDAIPDELEQARVYKAISHYSLYGVEPEGLSPMGQIIFTMALPNISAAQKKWDKARENGSKGGRPKEINEARIRELKAQGLTNREVAEQLGCSEKSVERVNVEDRQNRQNLNVNVNINENTNTNTNTNINVECEDEHTEQFI